MKILIANDGVHAHLFERVAWMNAFNKIPNVTCAMYECGPNARVFDVFNSYEPDIFIGQLYNMDKATYKCILNRPHMKVALRGGEWAKELQPDPNVLNITQEQANILYELVNNSGKPDFIYTHYQQHDIENTHSEYKNLLNLNLVGIPMSADITVYNNAKVDPALECDIGFVGGYWQYKGQIINAYLTELCFNTGYNIKIFGNQPWKHVNQYCGFLPDNKVKDLFLSAKICPNLSEPHSHTRGIDVNERVFKILASGGFCIMDNIRAAKEMFPKGVVFVKNPREFKEKIDFYLESPEERHIISKTGRSIVLERHTNFDRVELLFRNFNEPNFADECRRVKTEYVKNTFNWE